MREGLEALPAVVGPHATVPCGGACSVWPETPTSLLCPFCHPPTRANPRSHPANPQPEVSAAAPAALGLKSLTPTGH